MGDKVYVDVEFDDHGATQKAEKLDKAIGNIGKTAAGPASSGLTQFESSVTRATAKGAAFGLMAYQLAARVATSFTAQAQAAVQVAARTEALGAVADFLGQRAGKSSQEIAKLTSNLKAQGITTQEASNVIIQLTRANLGLENATKLASAAQNAAFISGMSSSEALGNILHGVVTLQPEVIRYAGITVSLEQAMRQEAQTRKKSIETLTQQERQQLLLNAVLKEAEKIQGTYALSMQYVGKQMSSIPRYVEEAQNAIGKEFLPVLGVFVRMFTEMLKWVTAAPKEFILLAASITALGASFAWAKFLPTWTGYLTNFKSALQGMAAMNLVETGTMWGTKQGKDAAGKFMKGEKVLLDSARSMNILEANAGRLSSTIYKFASLPQLITAVGAAFVTWEVAKGAATGLQYAVEEAIGAIFGITDAQTKWKYAINATLPVLGEAVVWLADWIEHSGDAANAQALNVSQTRLMAEASRVAGHEVKEYAQALAILTAEQKRLSQEAKTPPDFTLSSGSIKGAAQFGTMRRESIQAYNESLGTLMEYPGLLDKVREATRDGTSDLMAFTITASDGSKTVVRGMDAIATAIGVDKQALSTLMELMKKGEQQELALARVQQDAASARVEATQTGLRAKLSQLSLEEAAAIRAAQVDADSYESGQQMVGALRQKFGAQRAAAIADEERKVTDQITQATQERAKLQADVETRGLTNTLYNIELGTQAKIAAARKEFTRDQDFLRVRAAILRTGEMERQKAIEDARRESAETLLGLEKDMATASNEIANRGLTEKLEAIDIETSAAMAAYQLEHQGEADLQQVLTALARKGALDRSKIETEAAEQLADDIFDLQQDLAKELTTLNRNGVEVRLRQNEQERESALRRIMLEKEGNYELLDLTNKLFDARGQVIEQSIQTYQRVYEEAKAAYDDIRADATATARDVTDAWEKMWEAQFNFLHGGLRATGDLLQELVGDFQALAQIGGEHGLGTVAREIGTIIGALSTAHQGSIKMRMGMDELEKDSVRGWTNIAAGAAQAITAIDQATQSTSRLQNAIGGALAGAQAGAAFGPWGIAVGAIVGGVTGALRGGEGAKVNDIRDAYKESEGGADAIYEKLQKIGRLDLWRPLMAGPGHVKDIEKAIKDIEKAVAEYQARIEAGGRMADAFGRRMDSYADKLLGHLSDYDKLTEDAKSSAEELNQAIADGDRDRVEELLASAQVIQQGMDKAAADINGLAEKAQGTFNTMGQYAAATFTTVLRTTGSLYQAWKAVEEPVGKLLTLQERLGLEANGTTQKFLDMQKSIAGAADQVEALDSVRAMVEGMGAAGQLTSDFIKTAGADVKGLFDSMVEGGMSSEQALALAAPTLQTLWENAEKYHLAVDEGTQALIDQARSQGLVGDHMKDVNERILQVLEAIAKVFGADLPEEAGETRNAISGIGSELDGVDWEDFYNRGVNALEGVRDSASHLVLGRSPGLVHIPQELNNAIEAAKNFRDVGEASMEAVRVSIADLNEEQLTLLNRMIESGETGAQVISQLAQHIADTMGLAGDEVQNYIDAMEAANKAAEDNARIRASQLEVQKQFNDLQRGVGRDIQLGQTTDDRTRRLLELQFQKEDDIERAMDILNDPNSRVSQGQIDQFMEMLEQKYSLMASQVMKEATSASNTSLQDINKLLEVIQQRSTQEIATLTRYSSAGQFYNDVVAKVGANRRGAENVQLAEAATQLGNGLTINVGGVTVSLQDMTEMEAQEALGVAVMDAMKRQGVRFSTRG